VVAGQAGVGNTAGPGGIPDTVRYAFYFGGAVLLLALGWTVFRTREYPPEVLAAFDDAQPPEAMRQATSVAPRRSQAIAWLVVGLAGVLAIAVYGLDKQLYILAGGIAAYGVALLLSGLTRSQGMFATIMRDVHEMPPTMRKLAVVQFFSWFALFAMWIYTTAVVTAVHFGSTDTTSAAYNEGANWVGVLFAAYNGFAALAAIVIPQMVKRWGLRISHLVNTTLGGIGLLSFVVIRDPHWLLLSMVGVGFAWASILSLPYALLSDSVPSEKMGVFMGIFNFFIVIPQLVAASLLGFLLKTFLGGQPLQALVIGGISLIVAGLCVLRVAEPRVALTTAAAGGP
jgi:maltose/moltooligosaccharide transporter